MILACTYSSIPWKERLQPISLTFLLRFCLLGRSWFSGSDPPMGNLKYPTEQLREYNNIAYKDGETINSFNLRFTKLYNQISELI
jgi:hypothetical protein